MEQIYLKNHCCVNTCRNLWPRA